MEGIEINGKIDLGVRRLIVAHVENAITFYGYMVSFTRLKLFSIIDGSTILILRCSCRTLFFNIKIQLNYLNIS